MNPISGLSRRQGNRLIEQIIANEVAIERSAGPSTFGSSAGGSSAAGSSAAGSSAGGSSAWSPLLADLSDLAHYNELATEDNYNAVYDSEDEDESGIDPCLRLVDDDELIGMHEDDDDVDDIEDFNKKDPEHLVALRRWALICNVPKRHLNMLLKVLNKSHGNYPLDSRTLLKTPREPTKSIVMSPGNYYHYGLKRGLLSYPSGRLFELGDLSIDISTDGFAFAKSSKRCGWPIFASVVGSNLDPILIGLYIGRTRKPDSIDDFMRYFVDELTEMNGQIELPCGLNEVVILNFNIRLCVADSPARCFVVSTRHHGHKFGCHRCNQVTVNRSLQSCKGDPRTNETFCNRIHADHHSEEHKTNHSLLEINGFKMISQFPIDVMHMMDLGVSKLILSALIEKKMTFGPSNNTLIDSIKSLYSDYAQFSPSEFARTPRSLDNIKNFKATEFRQFILNTGIVFLKKYVDNNTYQHFLCASLGYRIISSSNYDDHNGLITADKLFSDFVKHFKRFYKRNLVYNVHNMLHLVECVKEHGKVDNFSAYKYENAIRKLQYYVRNNVNIFSQINNRLAERDSAGLVDEVKGKKPYKVTASNRDNCFKLGDNNYVIVTEVLACKTRCKIRHYKAFSLFFDTLFSTAFGIVQVDDKDLSVESIIKISLLTRKCYRLPYEGTFVIIPFII